MEEYHIVTIPKEPTREEKARDVLSRIAMIRRDNPGTEYAISYNGELVDEDELIREVKKSFPDFDTPKLGTLTEVQGESLTKSSPD